MTRLKSSLRSIVDHDGAVILDIEHNTMLTINATGSYILERIEQGKQIDVIVRELASDTGADMLEVDRDVSLFLEDLKSKHLLTV
jgi:Coenzyme PQQ synthesis protein D (PqqD)